MELHRPLSRSRFEIATTTILAVMLVWVNEKVIFGTDFARVVFDWVTMSLSLAHMTTPTRNKHNRGAASAVIEVTV